MLWAANLPEKLPTAMRELINDQANTPFFSAASIWELAIKKGREPGILPGSVVEFKQELARNLYRELVVTAAHASFVEHLPPIHKDPFDRLLVAQAHLEKMRLLTVDAQIHKYLGR